MFSTGWSELNRKDADVVFAPVFCGMLHQGARHFFGGGHFFDQLDCLIVFANIPQPVAGNYQKTAFSRNLKLLNLGHIAGSLCYKRFTIVLKAKSPKALVIASCPPTRPCNMHPPDYLNNIMTRYFILCFYF